MFFTSAVSGTTIGFDSQPSLVSNYILILDTLNESLQSHLEVSQVSELWRAVSSGRSKACI